MRRAWPTGSGSARSRGSGRTSRGPRTDRRCPSRSHRGTHLGDDKSHVSAPCMHFLSLVSSALCAAVCSRGGEPRCSAWVKAGDSWPRGRGRTLQVVRGGALRQRSEPLGAVRAVELDCGAGHLLAALRDATRSISDAPAWCARRKPGTLPHIASICMHACTLYRLYGSCHLGHGRLGAMTRRQDPTQGR